MALICDVDEFLVLHKTDTIEEFVANMLPASLGIAFRCKAFGTTGLKEWRHSQVSRTFQCAAERESPANASFKSMFRGPFDLEKSNRNGVRDETALRFRARFDALYAQAMAIPSVRRLHHPRSADYVARLAEKKGIKPAQDPRWQSHIDQAVRATG